MRVRTTGVKLVAVAAVFGAVALQATPIGEAREAFADAQSYLKQNDLRAAKVSLMNAVKADPAYTDALILQAKVALDLFDPLAAQSALERAVAAGVPQQRIAHLLGHGIVVPDGTRGYRSQPRNIIILQTQHLGDLARLKCHSLPEPHKVLGHGVK